MIKKKFCAIKFLSETCCRKQGKCIGLVEMVKQSNQERYIRENSTFKLIKIGPTITNINFVTIEKKSGNFLFTHLTNSSFAKG